MPLARGEFLSAKEHRAHLGKSQVRIFQAGFCSYEGGELLDGLDVFGAGGGDLEIWVQGSILKEQSQD